MINTGGDLGWSPKVHPGIGIAVCVVVNCLVAYAIYSSSYGSVFFMSDDPRNSIVWIPLLVGVVVGCIESLSFGVRIAAVASVLSVLVGGSTLFLLGTLALAAIGGIAGWVVAWALARWRTHVVWVSRLTLGAISVVAAASVTVAVTRDINRVSHGDTPPVGPVVTVRIDGDSYPDQPQPPRRRLQ